MRTEPQAFFKSIPHFRDSTCSLALVRNTLALNCDESVISYCPHHSRYLSICCSKWWRCSFLSQALERRRPFLLERRRPFFLPLGLLNAFHPHMCPDALHLLGWTDDYLGLELLDGPHPLVCLGAGRLPFRRRCFTERIQLFMKSPPSMTLMSFWSTVPLVVLIIMDLCTHAIL